MSTRITIASLSEDILSTIFTLAQASPLVSSEIPSRITVSHVSKRWRALSISSPLLWVNIEVTSRCNLDALRENLFRSRECELDIHFFSSGRRSRLRGRTMSLREATLILLKHAARWRSLSVTSPRAILDPILQLISHVPFPRLQRLQLMQNDIKSTVSHCGPLVLNPMVFSTLKLRGVIMHCLNPSNLAGVTSIDFSATSSCVIDQAILDTLGGVTSPIHPPSMLQLMSLAITAENPSVPLHPTFRMSTLVSLKLGGFSGSFPTLIAPFVQLFNTLSSPSLRHLEIDNLLGSAWDAFLQSLQSTITPKYPGLKTLTMRSLQLCDIDANFATAFPALTHLNLFEVDPSPIILLKHAHSQVWHGLTLSADGIDISHRTQIGG